LFPRLGIDQFLELETFAHVGLAGQWTVVRFLVQTMESYYVETTSFIKCSRIRNDPCEQLVNVVGLKGSFRGTWKK
jgi:hypothetical protein